MTDLQDASRPENAGPESDAIEAEAAAESAAYDTLNQAAIETPKQIETKAIRADEEVEAETAEPSAKLERLQKILAQAGIASRRHAEELIAQGRVQVNGAVVTTLGSKADPSRDHIRVDGKLLKGAERLRYFVMNKPKGFVTTVSDPEGRPTVMQFFDKMRERLYPVGRLDYLSEGLLLVTNDGDLANKLTKASSGVEKTYLVKVSGQPDEESLDRLRAGVAIERGRPGSGQVHTAPSSIRLMRHGDNPWYEVVLIEGRNRELRKMFEEIGHHVEKIRRVGYGPLVLDLEPGKLRELDPEEVERLRLASEGKLRTRKAKERPRPNGAETRSQRPGVGRRREESRRTEFERRPGGRRGDRPKGRFGGDRQGRTGPGRSGRSEEARPDRIRGQYPGRRSAEASHGPDAQRADRPKGRFGGDRQGRTGPGRSGRSEEVRPDRNRGQHPSSRSAQSSHGPERGPMRADRAWSEPRRAASDRSGYRAGADAPRTGNRREGPGGSSGRPGPDRRSAFRGTKGAGAWKSESTKSRGQFRSDAGERRNRDAGSQSGSRPGGRFSRSDRGRGNASPGARRQGKSERPAGRGPDGKRGGAADHGRHT